MDNNTAIKRQKSLDDLSIGDYAFIDYIKEACQDDTKRRLLELGFVKGSKIKKNSVSILKEVILVEICGYMLCLRRDIAKRIIIRDKQYEQ